MNWDKEDQKKGKFGFVYKKEAMLAVKERRYAKLVREQYGGVKEVLQIWVKKGNI